MDSNKALYGLPEIIVVPTCVLLVTGLICGVLVLLGWMAPGKAMMASSGLFVAGLVLTQLFRLGYDIRELKRQNRDIIANRVVSQPVQQQENTQIVALLDQGKDLQEAVMLLRQRIVELESSLTEMRETPSPSVLAVPSVSPTPAPVLVSTATPTPISIESGSPPKPVEASPPAAPEPRTETSFGDNKLTMHLQPIVALPNNEPMFFDALMRLQKNGGAYVDDLEFEKLAEVGGMLPAIEKKVIFSSARAIGMLKGAGQMQQLIASLSLETFKDGATFGDIIGFLAARGDLQKSLVFSIDQRDFSRLDHEQRGRMSILYNMGFRFMLDRMLDLNAHPGALAAAGFRYVKVPATIVAHANIGTQGRITPQILVKTFADKDLQLIATDVEREEDKDRLMLLKVKFAQGGLLGKPRALKPEFVDNKQAAA